ncbi:hypothetical protein COL5a_004741 [Colletotrichum fioriniae]|uniref:uncharacterized protein n=1 Tax=Colletotrichum fioriniae TaxID=710243 RepID=UPI0032DA50B2|nr:hypothetical protein COL5a_004741 [Colletotrichum fioriniae]KAJ3940492.1 hypothetical protein N0V96_009496 [Colletotrichum fioriniae]
MWLPPKHRIPATIDPNLQEGAYNHPVIIMSRIPSPEGLVEIFMITSMGSRGIAQAHTPDWAHWLKYVPIKPATHPSMPDTQLCFPDNCAPLAKNSYVNIRQIHSIHLEALRPYRLSGGDPPVLGKASFKSLKKVSGFIDLYDLTSSDSNTSKRLKRSKNRDVEASLPEFEDLEVDPQETVQSDGAGLLLLVLLAVVFLHLYIKSKA